jgi:hypothetical protein
VKKYANGPERQTFGLVLFVAAHLVVAAFLRFCASGKWHLVSAVLSIVLDVVLVCSCV